MSNLPCTASRAAFTVRLLGAAVLALTAGIAQSQVHGPEPTVASLEAAAGPYAIGNSAIGNSAVGTPNGYGAGTVFYPTVRTEGQFGVVVLAPGFTGGAGLLQVAGRAHGLAWLRRGDGQLQQPLRPA